MVSELMPKVPTTVPWPVVLSIVISAPGAVGLWFPVDPYSTPVVGWTASPVTANPMGPTVETIAPVVGLRM